MSRTKLNDGRINQKKRTRKALLDAAISLIDKGLNPTIDEIAEEAQVSRATAYRYFPNTEKLMLEASLDKKFLTTDALFKGKKLNSLSDKINVVHDYLFDFVANNEVGFRLYLKACMEEWVSSEGKSDKYIRGGRRLIMIDDALKEIRDKITEKNYNKLRATIAAMTSVEAYIALKDVCCLSDKEAKDSMKWSIDKLVNSVMEESQNN